MSETKMLPAEEFETVILENAQMKQGDTLHVAPHD